jgi:mannose PTS system EIIA component
MSVVSGHCPTSFAPMPGLLIVAHAPLASALRAVAAHVYPDDAAGVAVLDVPASWSADQVEVAARSLLAQVSDPQALILCDVFGATPCNGAQRLADGQDVRMVCGVNVAMLWRAMTYARDPIESLLDRAVAGGTQGVVQVGPLRPQQQSSGPLAHDQESTHHQQ